MSHHVKWFATSFRTVLRSCRSFRHAHRSRKVGVRKSMDNHPMPPYADYLLRQLSDQPTPISRGGAV